MLVVTKWRRKLFIDFTLLEQFSLFNINYLKSEKFTGLTGRHILYWKIIEVIKILANFPGDCYLLFGKIAFQYTINENYYSSDC